MWSEEDIERAADLQTEKQTGNPPLATKDPLWIRMYIDNLRKECDCGNC